MFEGLPPGIYDLIISGAGLVDHHVDPFVVEAGQVKDVGVLMLDRGRALRGRVLDAAGAPVAGASVHAGDGVWGNEKGFFASSPAPVKTGPDGSFTVTALARGPAVAVADHPVFGRSARPVGLGRSVTLTATTDAEGRYRFERLAEGAYVITAQLVRDGVHALAFPAKAGQASISAAKEARLDLAIPEGPLLVTKAKLTRGAADMLTATLHEFDK
jgi:hypothetical protein